MRKLALLFTLFSFVLGVYAQKTEISGEQQVCPNTEYTYTFKLAKPAVANNLTVFIKAVGGEISGAVGDMESIQLNIVNSVQSVSFKVKWKDKGYKTLQKLTASTSEGYAEQDIYVASFQGTQASDYSYYGFNCSALDTKTKTLRIPYNKIGKLSMSVNTSTAFYHKMTKTEYKTSTYNWKIGSTEIQGGYYKELDYGLTDLDGTTVSVYPVITACNRTSNGPAATFKIERYVDANIQIVSNKIVCKNENINYKLEGIPSGSVIQWIAGSSMSIISGQGSSIATFQSQNPGYNTITANVTYAGKNYTFKNSEVWVGPPIVQEIPKANFVSGQSTEITANFEGLEATSEFKWTRVSGDIYMSRTTGRSITVTPWDNNYFVIRVDVTNRCGTGSGLYQFKAGSGGLGGGGLNSLSLKSSIISDTEFTPQSIKVYNLSGSIVYSNNNLSGDFDIKSTTLPEGIYIIEKSDGKERQSEKVILKR